MGSAELHQHHAIRRPLAHCPDCGSDQLDPFVDLVTEEVHFACQNCGAHWQVELGYVRRVGSVAGS
jgi:transposase-like protein